MTRIAIASILIALGLFSLGASPALAQDDGSATDNGSAAELGYRPNEGAGLLSDDQAALEDEDSAAPPQDATDPHEIDSEDYKFLGLFYRHSFIPAFIIDLFTDEATGARNPSFGLEFTLRKAGFDIITSLYYQSFHVNGPFLAHNDPPAQVEFINSSLFTVMGGVDFLWSTAINDMFSIEYGLGLGIGMVGGDLTRAEAYPGTGAGSVGGYSPCVAEGTPQPGDSDPGGYCDRPSGTTSTTSYTDRNGTVHNNIQTNVDGQSGAHYHIKARRWTDGGSVPNVYFRLALPHLALRFKPIHQLMMRVDGGFDVFSGFFVGGSIAYGF